MYTDDTTNGSFRPAEILYTGHATVGTSPATKIIFVYETVSRPDPIYAYRFGTGGGTQGQINEFKRLDRIDVQHIATSTIVRTYELTYEAGGGAGGRSRLDTIQECRAGDCFSATDLSWINGTSSWASSEGSTGQSIPAGVTPLVGDISGDGLEDLVWSSTTTSGSGFWYYMLGTASGYTSAASSGIANWNYSHAQAIEWNGDGLMDVLVPCNGTSTWCVLQANGSGFTGPTNTTTPSTGFNNQVLAADVDGDARDDLVRIMNTQSLGVRLRGASTFGSESTAYGPMAFTFITGDFAQMKAMKFRSLKRRMDFNGDSRQDFVLKMRYDEGPGGNILDYIGTFFGGGSALTTGGNVGTTLLPELAGDFNGDGLTDLYFFTASTTYARLAKGTGFSSNVAGPPATGLVGLSALALDYDGDGMDDLVVAKSSPSSWHLSRSTGNGFATLANLSLSGWSTSHRAADFNGDGLVDMVGPGADTKFRAHEGVYPDLLDRVTDGFGMYVDFNYAPLTAGAPTYTKGSGAGFPTIDYQGPLYVVSSTSSTDGIGGTYSTTFKYEQARHHYQGRGFLGFGKFISTDSRNSISTEQTFLQNPAEFQWVGALDLAQVKQSGGTLIAETDNTWSKETYSPGLPTERRFPFVSQQVVKRWEVGGPYNGNLLSTRTTNNTVDSTSGMIYDSTTTTVEATTANGVQASASYSARTYHPTVYLLNDASANWCIGRPGRTEFINSHSQYGGSALTRAVSRTWDSTACRVTQEIIEPDSTQWKVTRDLTYDSWGNVDSEALTGIGMPVRTTTAGWGTTGRFLASATNPLSQTTQFGWDASIGVLTSQTDPNGLLTEWFHDGFGRRTREDRPDGTDTTVTYSDCASVSGGCLNSNNKMVLIATHRDTSDNSIVDQWTYLDKFNRPLASKNLMLSGSYSRTDREYDALGRIQRESAPCWVGSCTNYWTTFAYDLLNRVTQVSRPTSDSDPTLATTTTSFEGLTRITTDALGKQSTQVVNVLGGPARSKDHGGYYQTFDADGFGNLVRVTDSASNTLQSITYNMRGMKTAQNDMDLGSWSFTPNALGEVVSQTDANSQTATFEYDKLSRLARRIETEGTSDFTWGTSSTAKNIGRLLSMSGPGYSESYGYDSVGRMQTRTIVSDATHTIDYAYNALGLLHSLTYPTSTSSYRLKLQYDYQNGHLQRVKDFDVPSTVFWEATGTDARGNVIAENLGNGLVTSRGFDLVTGLIDSIQTGPGGSATIQNLSYVWNTVGNLTERQDVRQGLTEEFLYDDLHRLDSSELNSTPNLDLTYDQLGNITYKSDVGSYTYHATKKHAVTAAGSNTFTYDDNGNAITRNGYAIEWYSFNLPAEIDAAGSNSSDFFYAPDRSRWKQVASYGGTDETTIYIGGLIEKVTRGGVTSWKHYIAGGAGAVAVYTRKSDATNAIHYLTKDHLGSVDSVTNAAGTIEVRLSFASFGARRNEAGWTGNPTSGDVTQIEATTRRGFTSHEMLDNLNLTHMNGRVYDPAVGRFLSADPVVQAPGFTQSFNRYAYVWNSPLSFADPGGFEAVGRRWLCIDGQCHSTPNPIGDAWPRVQQPNRESQVSGNGVGNNPVNRPTTRDPPEPPDPSTGACVPGATPGFNPANGMCNVAAQSRCLANAPEGLAATNEAWRNNDDAGRTYTVDASKLSVRQIGPFTSDGRALGVVEGPDFLVFGNVTLLRDSTGTITIEAERYDFEMHGASWHGGSQTRAFARNAETFLGFLAATHGGWTEFWSGLNGGNLATDFTFEFVCSPQVN